MRQINKPIEGLDYHVQDTKKETSDLQALTQKMEQGMVTDLFFTIL